MGDNLSVSYNLINYICLIMNLSKFIIDIIYITFTINPVFTKYVMSWTLFGLVTYTNSTFVFSSYVILVDFLGNITSMFSGKNFRFSNDIGFYKHDRIPFIVLIFTLLFGNSTSFNLFNSYDNYIYFCLFISALYSFLLSEYTIEDLYGLVILANLTVIVGFWSADSLLEQEGMDLYHKYYLHLFHNMYAIFWVLNQKINVNYNFDLLINITIGWVFLIVLLAIYVRRRVLLYTKEFIDAVYIYENYGQINDLNLLFKSDYNINEIIENIIGSFNGLDNKISADYFRKLKWLQKEEQNVILKWFRSNDNEKIKLIQSNPIIWKNILLKLGNPLPYSFMKTMLKLDDNYYIIKLLIVGIIIFVLLKLINNIIHLFK